MDFRLKTLHSKMTDKHVLLFKIISYPDFAQFFIFIGALQKFITYT